MTVSVGNVNAGGLTFDAISNSASAAYTFQRRRQQHYADLRVLPSIDIMDNASSTGGRITFSTALTANNLTIRNSDVGNVGFALLNLSGSQYPDRQ